jgi:hypothetical protein
MTAAANICRSGLAGGGGRLSQASTTTAERTTIRERDVTRAICRWLLATAQAEQCRSPLGGQLEATRAGLPRLGSGSGRNASEAQLIYAADAARLVRHCSLLETAVLRQRYWGTPTWRPVYERLASGGRRLVSRRACWQSYPDVARALQLRSAHEARQLIRAARGRVRRALEEIDSE